MIKLAAQFVPLKVNAEKEGKDLASKYNVRGYPTILFVDGAGKLAGRIGGYMPPGPFADEMKKVQETQHELPKIRAALKKNPNDGEANAKLAAIISAAGERTEAEAALAKAEKAGFKGEALARAYNGVGDLYQSDRKFKKAIEFFNKADAAAKTNKDRAYAKVSVLACCQSLQDKKGAAKAAKELLAMKDVPEDWRKMAERITQP